jgi:hypothetical protein
MASVLAYHPETGAEVMTDDEAMVHLRMSGWMLRSEHEENVAAAQAAADEAAKSAKPAAGAASKEK